MKTKNKPRKRWQFTWCDENSPPARGDSHAWKTKVFRVATFEKAMDRMVEFVRGKHFVCIVDGECAALHEPYSPDDHERHFKRIDHTEHELAEYVE